MSTGRHCQTLRVRNHRSTEDTEELLSTHRREELDPHVCWRVGTVEWNLHGMLVTKSYLKESAVFDHMACRSRARSEPEAGVFVAFG